MQPRLPLTLVGLALAGLVACGGGGGGGSTQDSGYAALDSDPNATPAPDAAYHNVPSTALGALVSGSTVTFNYWNPVTSSAQVRLYANWSDPLSAPAASLPMARGAGGVWSTGPVALPAQGYYVYDAGGTLVLDPYARSMAQWAHNGYGSIAGDSLGKGAILDPALVGPDGGWAPYSLSASTYFDGSAMKGTDGTTTAPYAYGSNRDAIVYEAGVRDLTVDPFLTGFAAGHPWGTFKGLVDLLPHIQKLGVTHVQLLCPLENYYYDQALAGQRELDPGVTAGANYNWGYDPQNYFTPSGMYSADPADPGARINELKTLVNEIHKQGMGVVLDVVYNHTANDAVLGDAALPGYYYRSSSRNGAGSRDVRSEAKMTRKLIVDSIRQWVGDYHVDGFRFDLMGVLDTGTLQAAYAAARDLNPHVLFLGEGWRGFYTGAGTDYNGTAIAGSDQSAIGSFSGMDVAMFSDSYRQIFKNGYPSDGAPAFLTGQAESASDLFRNVAGLPTNFSPGSPDQVADYLTCHDNLCLHDAIALATGAASSADATVLKRARIAYAVLLSSQGLAFIHAGDEMFRTKATTAGLGAPNTRGNGTRVFVDNSYNASDAINMVRWSTVYAGDPIGGGFTNYATAQDGCQLYQYVQGLIALRKATNAFRLPDGAAGANLAAIAADGGTAATLAFGCKAAATDGSGTYYVLHNADTVAHSFTVDQSLAAAAVLADGAGAGVTPIAAPTGVTVAGGGLSVTLAPLTSAILRR
jgi:pullulanase/glycogen debranching enzyme